MIPARFRTPTAILAIGFGVFAAIVNLPVNERPLAERRPAVGVA